MSGDTLKTTDFDITTTDESNEPFIGNPFLVARLRNGLWVFGIPSWLFGIADRGIASFADGYLSAVEVLQLITAFFFFVSWLYLKPEESVEVDDSRVKLYHFDELSPEAQSRMTELQDYHLISQEYILPFHYLCQIYHLLNLKHLETVHHFSLNNLRVIKVSDFEPTQIGGIIRFQTVLDSPVNALRIWRQPIVEVELVLHSLYTVELRIPVYNGKTIVVMFNVLPLSDNEHKLFIDIYSNLGWPKPLLQVLMHFAACLTLFEDLPYLQKLAERNIHRVFSASRASTHETMLLFKRFVDLYGQSIEAARPMRSLPQEAISG